MKDNAMIRDITMERHLLRITNDCPPYFGTKETQ